MSVLTFKRDGTAIDVKSKTDVHKIYKKAPVMFLKLLITLEGSLNIFRTS
jgi:hypothetical protein